LRAIRVHATGGPEVLGCEEVADPRPGPGEVLVRLRAAGVNPVETYIRAGQFGRRPDLPYTPGSDGAGEVLSAGEGVSGLHPGQRVWVAGAPTYAEMVAAPAQAVLPLPDHLSYEQGAAIGIPYRTAYLALHLAALAQPGDLVLVRGGSGGVGVAAIQVASAHGCRVVATAGTGAGRDLVLAQGAEAAAGHGEEERLRELSGGGGYDVIVEMLANANLPSDLALLAPRGRVAIVGSRGPVTIDPRQIMQRSAAVRGVMGMTDEERRRVDLALLAGLRRGGLVPVVGRRFPLEEAAAAHGAVMSPGAAGKIVLTM
jgi:NADPH2:quinone reductase